jgi:AcrR family transcriptional regulator
MVSNAPPAASFRGVAARTGRELSPRRPQISRQFLEEHRRRRYVEAAAELLHEFGREGPTVTNIVRMAGTARNSFYEVFGGAEDCIAYGIGAVVEELFATLAAQDGEGEWLGELDEAISGFYGAVAAEPILAELFLIHAASSRVEEGRSAARAGAEHFVDLLARGRAEAEAQGRRPLPAPAEEYFSRAIVSVAAGRVRRADLDALPEESRPMAALVGGFYLGPAAAEEILSGPTAGSVARR